MKKYLSLIGITALILLIGWLWYQSLFAYLAEHTYYFSMISSGSNRWIIISGLVCALLPILYLFGWKVNIKKLIIAFVIWAGIFWLIHSNIKWDPIWFWHIIIIFNTVLLVCLWLYLILWFSALWSWIERKFIKFKQLRWQEIFLTFGIWLCSFIVIVQILLWIGLLYWLVSWLLFLWLGFMIRYERKQLKKWWEIIWDILREFKVWLFSWEWNFNKKDFWKSSRLWYIWLWLLLVFSVAYLYMWIQNAFTPYSTAWDANHEYMYIPKILAENAWIYRWNTVAGNMPWIWHQFLTFIFSLTGCTNWRFGLSSDNIAISMNNISASLVLIFWIAIVFQVFSLINENKKNKNEEEIKAELKKWNQITSKELSNWNWFVMWWTILLLWLTCWMWAFLVIVDNKTDLWVMAISLLALLAGLIFLQNRKSSDDKKELLKYVLIAWLFFGFAALAKITAFVDLVLFGLLLVCLRFWSLTSLGLWIMVMWFVRKFNILTSSVMLTDENATWFIIVWLIIAVIWLIIHLLKHSNRKEFSKDIIHLLILWTWFIIPLILFKLPRSTISQIKSDNYSFTNSLRSVFLGFNTNENKADYKKLLAQNIEEEVLTSNEVSDSDTSISIETQNIIDNSAISWRNDQTFDKCSDIYSNEELNEWLQELNGWWWWEDLWRYIWYGWKEFKSYNSLTLPEEWSSLFKSLWPKSNSCEWLSDNENTICEKNLSYGLLKLIRPTSETCYGFSHDAKVLCNNAAVIDSFKIDDLRAIYENGINNEDWEAGQLLKAAIDAYDKAKAEWKIWFGTSNSAIFHDEIVNLRQYYQSHSISSTQDSIYIPYRYLVPLNISFNWSLQNLSSYYTDIGFIWVIIFAFLIIALPYAIFKKDKILLSVSLTTLIWWAIWWIIWSSILWYGTVLISRTMITLAIFWDRLLSKDKLKFLPWILIVLVWIIFWIQILFNFLRIASQWANSVFVWYKWNIGNQQIFDDNLSAFNERWDSLIKKKYWYWWKNIFDLQFPQYNPIIHALADRDNNDWVIIAWTYIQYFLWNQWNIKSDGMLWTFWKNSSDWDLCKTYRRLKKDNTRYLIIDPNIWTVTMWEGNETLFYRFFGKLDSTKSKIEMDGTITTLVRLYKAGYLKLLSTNNLWAKYAFTVDDDMINSVFGWNLTSEELILARSKMAVLQYFDDANSIFSSIATIFLTRVMNDPYSWIDDIANIYWLEIDTDKVANVAIDYINWNISNWFAKDLTQDERTVLYWYLNSYQAGKSKDTSQVQKLLLNSVTGSSQIIALELN